MTEDTTNALPVYDRDDYVNMWRSSKHKVTEEDRESNMKRLRLETHFSKNLIKTSACGPLLCGDVPNMDKDEMRISLKFLEISYNAKIKYACIKKFTDLGLSEITIMESQDERDYDIYMEWVEKNKDLYDVNIEVDKIEVPEEEQIYEDKEAPKLEPEQVDISPDLYPIRVFNEKSPICCRIVFQWR